VADDAQLPFFVHTLRVRYAECDPQGVVYNANYLMFLDTAFTELWRAFGTPYPTLMARGIDTMMVGADLSFRRPARADEDLDIALRSLSLGTTSLAFDATIRRDGDLLMDARLTYVFIDAAKLTKREVPDDVRELFATAVGVPR
jgi:acyl-CoA thioester hydrolase